MSESSFNAHIEADLQLLNEATAYRGWLSSQVQPFLGQRILEVGSGIGNYTEMLEAGRQLVWATDHDPRYIDRLQQRFAHSAIVVPRLLDISRIAQDDRQLLAEQGFDTCIIMNVLEHIEDDQETLAAMRDCLSPGGRIVLVLPALPCLFNSLDRAYEHFRRYSRRSMNRSAAALGMTVECSRYFNMVGIFGWWLHGSLRGKRFLPRTGTRVFNRAVPLMRLAESILPPPFGLSLTVSLLKDA